MSETILLCLQHRRFGGHVIVWSILRCVCLQQKLRLAITSVSLESLCCGLEQDTLLGMGKGWGLSGRVLDSRDQGGAGLSLIGITALRP